jgi:hypothetical protein
MEIIQCLGYHRPTADARAAMSTRSTQKTARKQHRPMADDVRERKREEIPAVAEALFFERGYAQTTVADIVDALGPRNPICITTSAAGTTFWSSCAGARRSPACKEKT